MVHTSEENAPGADNVNRRRFIGLGALTLGSVALPDLLPQPALAAPATKRSAVIQVVLSGGASHLETFDPKPNAGEEYRGPYRAIRTRAQGVELSELFPLLARQMDKFVILRSVTHDSNEHLAARHWTLTGHKPAKAYATHTEQPAAGAVAARFRGARKTGLPAYVCVPRVTSFADAAYLGAGYDPFEVVCADPNHNFSARDLQLPISLDQERLTVMRRLKISLIGMRRPGEMYATPPELEAFQRKALAARDSAATREALALGKERPNVRERYGRTLLGQSLLLARRLVEAGSTFVTVEDPGWDMHSDVKRQMDRKAPALDRGLAALAEDLAARGLLDQVLLVVHGEFGRTPRVNAADGRDHWPSVYSVLLGGGGLRTGRVVGASDARGEQPKDRPLRPEDVLATVYHALGIDHRQTVPDASGQAVPLLEEGTPIKELT